jgi:AraC-like DNA-binding protein
MGQLRSRSSARESAGAEVAFTAASFQVPRHYLGLLLGEAQAKALLRAQGKNRGTANGVIPSVTFLKLCLQRMRETRDESYGTSSRAVPKGTLGILMGAASHGNNFGEALARYVTANALLRPEVKVRLSRSRRALNLHIGYEGKRSARKELQIETVALATQCAFRWLTGAPLQPQQIAVAEPVGTFRASVLRGLFGCPVVQHARGVTISYELAAAHLPLAPVKYDAWAAQEYREFMRLLNEAASRRSAQLHDGPPKIVAELGKAIASGCFNEKAAAARLGMSPATLRRRLAEAGSTFQALRDRIQRDIAATLLMTDKPLEDIAAEIRYSDVRSFRRACLRWFGATPAAYRNAKRR